MYKNTVDVNSFLTDFSRVLSECGIDEKHAGYYLKWAQDFALSMKGVPLRERSVDDIRAFIAAKGQAFHHMSWRSSTRAGTDSSFLLFSFKVSIAAILFSLEREASRMSVIKRCVLFCLPHAENPTATLRNCPGSA